MDWKRGILTSGLLSAAIVIPSLVQAQETVNLDEIVVVSAYRTETNLSDVADNITVMDQADIEALPANSVAEVLSYASGIDIDTQRGFGKDGIYSTHGSDALKNQVKVLVDGIPLNTEHYSLVPLWNLSSASLSQVEILSGASSALWGSGFGGTINLLSKDPVSDKKISARARTLFGEFRKRQELVELSGTVDKFSYYTVGEHLASGTEKLDSDTSEVKTFSKAIYDFEDAGKITAVYGANSGSINSGYDADGVLYRRKYQQKFGKLGYALEFENAIYKAEAKFNRLKDSYALIDPTYGTTYRNKKAWHYQLSFSADYTVRDTDKLLLGLDMDWDSLKSEIYLNAFTAQTQAPYISYLFREGKWDVHLGLRYDHSEQFKDQVNPTFGLVYSLEDQFETKIRTRIARAYNYPRLNQQKASLDSTINWIFIDNMELKPETAVVYEAGMNTRPFEPLSLDLSIYHSDIKDYITSEFNGSNYQYINKQKYRKQGISLKMEYDITQQLQFMASTSFHRQEDRALRKRDRFGYLRMSYDLGLKYRGNNGINAALLGRYSYWPASSTSWQNPNDRKFLIDLKTEKKFEHFSIFMNVYNLTNSKYWHQMYEKYPERYFEGGVEVKF